jgi:putative SOS response-associated peptidase YedK
MCGRYLLTTPAEALARLFGFIDRPNLRPRYNVAPTQTVLAVLVDPETQRRAGAQVRMDRYIAVRRANASNSLTPRVLLRSDAARHSPAF